MSWPNDPNHPMRKRNTVLRHLLTRKSTSELYSRHLGGSEAYAELDQRNLDLNEWFDFANNTHPTSVPGRKDRTIVTVAEINAAKSNSARLADQYLFQRSVPEYNESRWLKTRPFIQWTSALLLTSKTGTDVLKHIK